MMIAKNIQSVFPSTIGTILQFYGNLTIPSLKFTPKYIRKFDLTTMQHNSNENKLVVIGSGANQIKPTLFLNGQKHSYLFNCGEGSATWFNTNHLELKKPVVFFTRASWDYVAGFPKLYTHYEKFNTLDKAQLKQYMGPSKCIQIFSNIIPKYFQNTSFEIIDNYEDEEFIISGIPLGDERELMAYSCKQKDFFGPLKTNRNSLEEPLDSTGIIPSIRKEGCDVHFSNIAKTLKKGMTFMIIECPEVSCINSICSHEHLQWKWYDKRKEQLWFIIHITPLSILKNEKYIRWMTSFGPKVHHVLLHSTVCPPEVALTKGMKFSLPLHMMNPEVYHFPYVSTNTTSSVSKHWLKFFKEEQVIIGHTAWRCILISENNAKPYFTKQTQDILSSLKYFQKSILAHCGPSIASYQKSAHGRVQNIRENFINHTYERTLSDNSLDCMVTFLGTGTWNSKFRNESGILLQTVPDGNILLDCGEGTVNQLKKCFGEKEGNNILRKLHTVFISHAHMDHFSGLLEILRQCFTRSGSSPVNVIAPNVIKNLIQSYQGVFSDTNCKIFDSDCVAMSPMWQSNVILKPFEVEHVPNSFGIKVSRGSDWTIVYSGDTRLCSNVLKEGRNATLLIHEGTYDDSSDTVDSSCNVTHSYYKDAVHAAKLCNACFTVITHFDSYSSLSSLRKDPTQFVFPAVDFMSLKVSDIKRHKLDSVECSLVFKQIASYLSQKH